MNKEIRLIVEAVSNEKEISREAIFEALEVALVSATKKRHGLDKTFRVTIDRNTGDYETYQSWTVVNADLLEDMDDLFSSDRHKTLEQAQALKLDAAIGDVIEVGIESEIFGRIAAQTAKQVIMQRLRAIKREQMVDGYRSRIGELVNGTVKKVTRDHIILDLGNNAEAFLKRTDMLPREIMRVNDRIRVYLKAVTVDVNGPQLVVSRTCPEMLLELFKLEVPEIGDGLIELKGAARDPGVRAKVAVLAKDTRIDPVGACVGMRGSRVQAVSTELGGERVDIILWDENAAQFVINALAPAEVRSIVVDDDVHSMQVVVDTDQLAAVIGRNGQNVRLASQLTGWELDIVSEAQAQEKEEEEMTRVQTMFESALSVDAELAQALVEAGFAAIEEVAYVPAQELEEIGLDADSVKILQQTAKSYLLTAAIAQEEHWSGCAPEENLLTLPGMERSLASELAGRGIMTRSDLADCAVDELREIPGMDADRAGRLIMAARAAWFDKH